MKFEIFENQTYGLFMEDLFNLRLKIILFYFKVYYLFLELGFFDEPWRISSHLTDSFILVFLTGICLSSYLYIYSYIAIYLSINLSTYQSIFLGIELFIYLSIYLSIYLIYLSSYIAIYISIYLSIYLSI